jgi:hypothetical protein
MTTVELTPPLSFQASSITDIHTHLDSLLLDLNSKLENLNTIRNISLDEIFNLCQHNDIMNTMYKYNNRKRATIQERLDILKEISEVSDVINIIPGDNIKNIPSLLSKLSQGDTPFLCKNDRSSYCDEHWIKKNRKYNLKFMPSYLNKILAHNIDLNQDEFNIRILSKEIYDTLNKDEFKYAYGSGAGYNLNEPKEILRFLTLIIICIYKHF